MKRRLKTLEMEWRDKLLSECQAVNEKGDIGTIIENWVIYLRRVVHQLLVRVVLRVESKEFHAVGHQLSKYMKIIQ